MHNVLYIMSKEDIYAFFYILFIYVYMCIYICTIHIYVYIDTWSIYIIIYISSLISLSYRLPPLVHPPSQWPRAIWRSSGSSGLIQAVRMVIFRFAKCYQRLILRWQIWAILLLHIMYIYIYLILTTELSCMEWYIPMIWPGKTCG